MITHELDKERMLLHVHPIGSLQKGDFEAIVRTVDPFIEKEGKLNGLVIESRHFPGWESFGAMIEHFKFVRNHHAHIERVALVTDSRLGDVAERIGSHFVSAEIRHFPSGQLDAAEEWASQNS